MIYWLSSSRAIIVLHILLFSSTEMGRGAGVRCGCSDVHSLRQLPSEPATVTFPTTRERQHAGAPTFIRKSLSGVRCWLRVKTLGLTDRVVRHPRSKRTWVLKRTQRSRSSEHLSFYIVYTRKAHTIFAVRYFRTPITGFSISRPATRSCG